MTLPLPTPIAATSLPQGAARLTDWAVLRAAGPDARSFLQGQLTQDVLTLAPGQARLAGYCSAKGRLLASFVIWSRGPDELMLACSADLLPALLKRLSMYVLRARCKLSDASGECPVWGLAGEAAARALGPAARSAVWTRVEQAACDVLRLPDAVVDGSAVPRWLWAGAPLAADIAALPALDADAWRWLEVMSGVPRVSAATLEQFVPQMVNLELVGGVNFQKGCYPGQEVVARSQYRGTLKRRAQIATGAVAPAPGTDVFHGADPAQPAGRVVLSGSAAGRHAALVELKLSALAPGVLHAGRPDGTALTLATLPYPVPGGDTEAD